MASKIDEIAVSIINEKYKSKIIFLFLFVICLLKLPSILTSDIQPWDEGLYAVRVLSIHTYGDFFDQSSHSIGNLFSCSHPPFLIWLGYFGTLIFGINEIVLKLIAFVFSLLCIIYIIKIGWEIYSFETGIWASLIFASMYLFNVFSKRFQFDIPLVFFILISFYYFILFNNRRRQRYLIYAGIAFGMSLMTKALIGLCFPFTLLIFFLIVRKKSTIKFSDILIPVFIGLAIALPWHLYMLIKHGMEFSDFLFGFHMISRAINNLDGIQPKKFYFFSNVFINNIPFGIIIVLSLIKDIKNYNNINFQKLILWIWFLSGIVTISLFKTKLDSYLLPFIIPVCILLVIYLIIENNKSGKEKFLILYLSIINISWFITQCIRDKIKEYISQMGFYEIIISIFFLITFTLILYFISVRFVKKINTRFLFLMLFIISFISVNVYYFVEAPDFENCYVLSPIKNEVEKSGRTKILYVSSDYKYNPQFTYYFNGIDIGWKNNLSYELADLKFGTDSIKNKIEALEKGEYILIVERKNINPGIYYDTKIFVPERFKLIKKSSGYEMYED